MSANIQPMSAYTRFCAMMGQQGGGGSPRRGGGSADSSLLSNNSFSFNDSDVSPLQMFGQAKTNINEIFGDIETFSKEAAEFILEKVAFVDLIPNDDVVRVVDYVERISGIREVLQRDHMKVVFFGRTSNGKSTVINAMMGKKILPSGIGHTTSCFLQIEGGDAANDPVPYLIREDSPEKLNVESIAGLANALCASKLNESSLVKIVWPKDMCPLLGEDVVLLDSPGIDISANLDDWIDKYCLNADVFVLVLNAESTLMVTEKNFFHKVSSQISKPNIFILNNRWDASVTEMDTANEVRAQHTQRATDFLVNELQVVTPDLVGERIFFISAKEALQARIQEQNGQPQQPGTIAEGFQTRYMEFQDFETKFEECISESAVKTKFEQHSHRGKAIVEDTKEVMTEIFIAAQTARSQKMNEVKELEKEVGAIKEKLELVKNEMEGHINRMVDYVDREVREAFSEEIGKLGLLVGDFSSEFHPDSYKILNSYKKGLHTYVKTGIGSKLEARLNKDFATSIETRQKEMIERMAALLPSGNKGFDLSGIVPSPQNEVFGLPHMPATFDGLCYDFKEDISFKFSFGIQGIMKRIQGRNPYGFFGGSVLSSVIQQGSQGQGQAVVTTPEELNAVSRIAFAALASQGGGLVLGYFLLKTVGWKGIGVAGGICLALYGYERLCWTHKAMEKELKKQYVDHVTPKLSMIVDITSATCSEQVKQKLSSNLNQLSQQVDSTTDAMNSEREELDKEIFNLEELSRAARILKSEADPLLKKLKVFDRAYLQERQRSAP